MTPAFLGYIATAIILFSFALRGEIKIRIVNMIGAIIFVVYGFLLPDIPISLLNIGIIAVHIWQFTRIHKESKAAKELADAKARAAEAEAKLEQKLDQNPEQNPEQKDNTTE